ncbi:unnamed protein product, partial [Lymnaea stagnalis]
RILRNNNPEITLAEIVLCFERQGINLIDFHKPTFSVTTLPRYTLNLFEGDLSKLESPSDIFSSSSHLMSLPICKFYHLNKTCRFGKHCRYAHSSDRPPSLITKINHEELLKDQASPVPALKESNPESQIACCLNKNETSISRDHLDEKSTEDSTHPTNETENTYRKENAAINRASNNKPTRKPLCHYFLSYGNCRYGNDCRFSHQLPKYDDKRNNGSRQRQRKEHEVAPRFRQDKMQNVPECVNDETIPNANEIPALVTGQGSQNPPKRPSSKNVRPEDENQKICPYFPSGRCWRGERCRFKHLSDLKSEYDSNSENKHYRREVYRKGHNDKSKSQEPTRNQRDVRDDNRQTVSSDRPQYETKRRIISRPLGVKQIFTYSELEDVGLAKVREMEINIIKKRFPKDKISINDGEKWTARLSFSPTDPDWPFDVSVFELLFGVPEDYPKKLMTITLPVDQDLPETVRRYVEISIKEWLEDKKEQLSSAGKVELVFRPFLRWFDRNIEDITTEALQQLKRELLAKAAGFEFIPANRLKDRFRTKSESSEEHEHSLSESEQRGGGSGDEDDSSEEEDDSSNESTTDENNDGGANVSLSLDPDKKGTELALQHLQLRENASALMFETLKLILQCQRCKSHSELHVPQNKVMSLRCEKCNQNQFVNYRPALIHQFSSVVGYLDVDGCQAFDLIFQDCRLVVTCLGCSKPTRINGLVTGQMIDGWCQACNARFKLATESVKFSQFVPSGIDTSEFQYILKLVPSTKTKKPPKDPAIREGCPLPEFGTCKHYKHSYRWLRFPCCGKAYSCDVCHDKKEDHEMILATRMICGHCCKEQVIFFL